jgi:hypothetical protein
MRQVFHAMMADDCNGSRVSPRETAAQPRYSTSPQAHGTIPFMAATPDIVLSSRIEFGSQTVRKQPHKGRSAFKTYGLYRLAAICWIPVVLIQIRMKGLLERQSRGETFDAVAYAKLFRLWFALGWPAFGGLVIIFWLMVTKPTW